MYWPLAARILPPTDRRGVRVASYFTCECIPRYVLSRTSISLLLGFFFFFLNLFRLLRIGLLTILRTQAKSVRKTLKKNALVWILLDRKRTSRDMQCLDKKLKQKIIECKAWIEVYRWGNFFISVLMYMFLLVVWEKKMLSEVKNVGWDYLLQASRVSYLTLNRRTFSIMLINRNNPLFFLFLFFSFFQSLRFKKKKDCPFSWAKVRPMLPVASSNA